MTLHCRVTRVNMEKFQVDLSSRSSDLADKEGKFRWECSASLYGLFSCSWAKRRSRSVTFDLIIAAYPRTCTMTKPLLRRTKRRNRWHWRRQTGQVSCQPGTDFNLNQNYQTKPKGVVTKRKAFGEMEKEFILSGKCTQATTQMRVLDVIFSQRCFQVKNMFKITGKWEIYKSFCPLPLKLWFLSIPCKYGG